MAVKRFCDECDKPCPEPKEYNGHATNVEIPYKFRKLGNVVIRYACFVVINADNIRKDLCPACAEKAICSVVVQPVTDNAEARQGDGKSDEGIHF